VLSYLATVSKRQKNTVGDSIHSKDPHCSDLLRVTLSSETEDMCQLDRVCATGEESMC